MSDQKKPLEVTEADIGRRVRIAIPLEPHQSGTIAHVGGLSAYVHVDGSGFNRAIPKLYLEWEDDSHAIAPTAKSA